MGPTFSRRVPADLSANRLTAALERIGRTGTRVIDLTESNPTRVGLDYPEDILLPLADARGRVYEPHPLGLPSAREAVAAEAGRRRGPIDPARIVLTASTSEAYSALFKLLCDPGDQVLVPRPSYPLFEHLARLDAVGAEPYWLDYHGQWAVDRASVERALSPRSRAVLVVNPNNPTGSCLSADDLRWLDDLCAARGLALIGDEVFADYPLADEEPWTSVLEGIQCLTCSLGGLSKSAGLPQVKLGWIALGGPEPRVRDALARLEVICDTYLSVSTPVQLAAGALIARGAGVRDQIRARVRENSREMVRLAGAHPSCSVLPAQAGWYAVIQVPANRSEEEMVLSLLEEERILVHPGYFFDFPREAFLVVSLLTPTGDFCLAIERLFRHVSA